VRPSGFMPTGRVRVPDRALFPADRRGKIAAAGPLPGRLAGSAAPSIRASLVGRRRGLSRLVETASLGSAHLFSSERSPLRDPASSLRASNQPVSSAAQVARSAGTPASFKAPIRIATAMASRNANTGLSRAGTAIIDQMAHVGRPLTLVRLLTLTAPIPNKTAVSRPSGAHGPRREHPYCSSKSQSVTRLTHFEAAPFYPPRQRAHASGKGNDTCSSTNISRSSVECWLWR